MLSGKTAVITGAGRNVGQGISNIFAEHGATVIINDIDEERATRVCNELPSDDSQRHTILVCDATDASAIRSAANEIREDYGTIDILVNNLGYAVNKNVFDTTEEEWDIVNDMTLKSVYLWTKYVGKLIVDGGTGGSIINLGSSLGHRGQTDKLAYCAAKGGVINLTRQLAIDLAEHDVRVNSISPGIVGDPVGQTTGLEERDASSVPLSRNGRPEDIGNGALYLASDLSEYVTGIDLRVDGGIGA